MIYHFTGTDIAVAAAMVIPAVCRFAYVLGRNRGACLGYTAGITRCLNDSPVKEEVRDTEESAPKPDTSTRQRIMRTAPIPERWTPDACVNGALYDSRNRPPVSEHLKSKPIVDAIADALSGVVYDKDWENIYEATRERLLHTECDGEDTPSNRVVVESIVTNALYDIRDWRDKQPVPAQDSALLVQDSAPATETLLDSLVQPVSRALARAYACGWRHRTQLTEEPKGPTPDEWADANSMMFTQEAGDALRLLPDMQGRAHNARARGKQDIST